MSGDSFNICFDTSAGTVKQVDVVMMVEGQGARHGKVNRRCNDGGRARGRAR